MSFNFRQIIHNIVDDFLNDTFTTCAANTFTYLASSVGIQDTSTLNNAVKRYIVVQPVPSVENCAEKVEPKKQVHTRCTSFSKRQETSSCGSESSQSESTKKHKPCNSDKKHKKSNKK